MKKIKLLLLGILMPWYAFAWHSNGHSTAGAIAYYYLQKNNPAVLKQVIASLKFHYWYNKSWKNRIAALPADEQDVALFMLASTYPDEAKADPNNADGNPIHKKWHYVDYPFVVPGSGVIGLPPETPNAKQKIADFMMSIPNEGDSPKKALELSWFFHIIEDIHQPLHCSSMFNKDHKTGDGGGNSTQVIAANENTDLHSYWDDLVKGKTLTEYAAHAQQLLRLNKYQDNKLSELTSGKTPDDWMSHESSPDAVKYAYANGRVNGLKSGTATTLTARYMTAARALGERRVVLSGIRLAKLLTSFYSKTAAPKRPASK